MKRMKKKLFLLLMVVGGFVLTGCSSYEEIKSDVQENVDKAVEEQVYNENPSLELPKVNLDDYVTADKNILDLLTKTYTDEQLKEIAHFSGTFTELNKIYPAECVRKEESLYRIVYFGNDNYTIIWFNENNESEMGYVFNKSCKLKCFEKLGNGDSLDDVMRLDPKGYYAFRELDVDCVKCSVHYTEDAFLVIVYYGDDDTIVNIQKDYL